MNKTVASILFFLITPPLAAETLTGNFWRCIARDAEKMEWIIESSYKISALNKALEECKKQSKISGSCKISKHACEEFVNGLSTRPMWQCTALDQMAKVWFSNVYVHRDDAAIAAKDDCQQGSAFPDTCYVNLVTCKNLNER